MLGQMSTRLSSKMSQYFKLQYIKEEALGLNMVDLIKVWLDLQQFYNYFTKLLINDNTTLQ